MSEEHGLSLIDHDDRVVFSPGIREVGLSAQIETR